MSTFEGLKTIIVGRLGVDEDRVVSSASLIDDLGMDSLDLVQFVMDAEDDLGVEIDDEALNKIVTVQDAVTAVDHALASQGSAA